MLKTLSIILILSISPYLASTASTSLPETETNANDTTTAISTIDLSIGTDTNDTTPNFTIDPSIGNTMTSANNTTSTTSVTNPSTECNPKCTDNATCLNRECYCKPYYLGDGTRCIHQDYIIITASCVGGGVIVILFFIIIGLCVKICKQKKELQIAELYQPSSYEVGNLHKKRKEVPPNPYEDVYNPPKSEEKAAFHMPQKAVNGHSGHDNRGYVEPPYDGPTDLEPNKERNLAELVTSDSYKNFTPYLGHIDPKADYSIKRPAYFGGTGDRRGRQDIPMPRRNYNYDY